MHIFFRRMKWDEGDPEFSSSNKVTSFSCKQGVSSSAIITISDNKVFIILISIFLLT